MATGRTLPPLTILLYLLIFLLSSALRPSASTPPVSVAAMSISSVSSAARRAADGLSVRVVTYNVLSSHLSNPDHFTHCHPADLDFDARVPKVLDRLDAEIKSSMPSMPVVFCLQEVSHCWAGHLHAFFANRRYHLITGLYGKKFNNYMGVALAYPTESYETVFTDVTRLSDAREGGWPKDERNLAVKATGGLGKLTVGVVGGLFRLLLAPVRYALRLDPPDERIDPWTMSENRFNVVVTACLRLRGLDENDEGGTFCISNYHMPCAFYAPPVMNIHAEMVVRHCEKLAGSDPHILAGDFNFMPDSPHYKLITTGELWRNDPSYPKKKWGMEWRSNIRGMRSAYAESNHGEPDFTNYAQVEDDEPFIGTLDYVFLSDEWDVVGIRSTPHRRSVRDGPYPNENEPSDHIVIAADLTLPSGGRRDATGGEGASATGRSGDGGFFS